MKLELKGRIAPYRLVDGDAHENMGFRVFD